MLERDVPSSSGSGSGKRARGLPQRVDRVRRRLVVVPPRRGVDQDARLVLLLWQANAMTLSIGSGTHDRQ